MLTASLYTNLAFFILFQHYVSVLTNETSAEDVFGNSSAGHLANSAPFFQEDDPTLGTGQNQRLPVFPERTDAVYFVVAVLGGAKLWGRMLAKTLLDLGQPFNNPHGPPLRPIYVDMPPNGRFSSKVLNVFCQQTENRPLAGVIVIGEGQSARAVALAGTAMKLPVLWAKGGTANLNGKHKEIETPLQALLQPSAKEILEAVRAIFLQTHWNSFFVMSDMESSMILKSTDGSSIRRPPLVPTILSLPARNGNIFKQLAEISKSTRGVVLLLCNLETARKIMSEAQRLNMVGGHFIWLWADTSSTTEFYDPAALSRPTNSRVDVPSQSGRALPKSRAPLGSVSAQSTSMGRQRENERNRDQRGGGLENRGRKTSGNTRRGHDNSDDLKRERVHLPVAGRSRPSSEHNDKSRNRRDFANPSAEQSSLLSHSGLMRNESLAANDDPDEEDGAAGDDEFYDVAEDVSSQHYQDGDEDRTEEDSLGYAESERRILELLGKTPPPERGESIRLAGTDNKSSASATPVPPLSSLSPDIDPLINFEQPSATPLDHQRSPDANKLKRMLNFLNMSDSDVLFHHFKDFPIGLLALRPVRMDVDRPFVKSAIQLFANTWKRIEYFPTPGSGHWRKRRRKRRSDEEGSNLNDSDNIDTTVGVTTSIAGVGKDQVNNSLEQSFNASDLKANINHYLRVNDDNQVNVSNKVFPDKVTTASGVQKVVGASTDLKPASDFNPVVTPLPIEQGAKIASGGILEADSEVLSNGGVKTKRKSEPNEQLLLNRLKSRESVQSTAGQQIVGAWAKHENGNKNTNNSPRGRRPSSPRYAGGCYGMPTRNDVKRAETFARLLRRNTQLALEGLPLTDGTIEKSLITQFELLNLVPMNVDQQTGTDSESNPRDIKGSKSGLTKWRRVGLITGTNVRLDTIVWPGGDIVVSGLSARPRSVFRVVTALAPPFVMESELDEDGLCLRGLSCHRLLPTGHNNLTQIFNFIETRGRLEQDALEHGWDVPESEEEGLNPSFKTKCCYGLSMDLLENVATELGFQFHLYLVRDELFGTKYTAWSQSGPRSSIDADGQSSPDDEQSIHSEIAAEPDWDQSNAAKDKKYFMSDEKIFGQKNPHVFYKLDAEGKPTKFNRDFSYMKDRREKDVAANTQKQKLRKAEAVPETKWNGIIGDLISGSADMSFAALSVSKSRVEVVDFSAPYFHSGVSLLAAPQTKSEIPLLAFLLPFSPELWIAIFTSLNITAVAVAVYEWLSPFGLNPWGRQRNKNFSMSSALWVMWGLLCGHLVAFKAPKSWPNKFLINVWGGFSVIFVASYTANIAALIAGLFFHNAANKYEASLFTQRLGTPRASAAEMYLQKNDRHLWEHMKKYSLHSLDEGITRLKNNTLDLLMADSPILDYYRATDPGCNLQRIGETYVEDAYAIGMTKGFPLKDSISELIAKYSSNGYLDILTEKWYGGLPCFKLDAEIVQPRPLELSALAGVYLLLGMGMILGVLILIFEHWFYKYTLPRLRHKPNDSVWKSPNIMFFSQKLYRFINCVELVSPHHAARELVHTLRQGQIASLFQKSIKRKEDEQRRRRKSKAQFFEMIQEIRRINFLSRIQQQQNEAPIHEVDPSLELNAILSPDKLSLKVSPKPPKGMRKDSRSRSNSSGLNVRRFSTDSILANRLDTIGRRLSRDVTNSPPDLGHRFDTLEKDTLTLRHGNSASAEMLTDSTKFDTNGLQKTNSSNGGHSSTDRKFNSRRSKMHLDVTYDRERERKKSADNIDIMPTLKERLAPPICLIEPNKAELRSKLHAELKSKYAPEPDFHFSTQPVAKPPRRGPLPLPPKDDGVQGGLVADKPGMKVLLSEPNPCSRALVVGMTPKIRPPVSPRNTTETKDSADQTVPITRERGRKNGKSKSTRGNSTQRRETEIDEKNMMCTPHPPHPP